MKQVLKTLVLASFVVFGLTLAVVSPEVSAQNALERACQQDPTAALCQDGETGDAGNVIEIVVNTLLFIIGVISVIMIIVGGIRYATSGGDSGSVNGAKNTIFYAVIGLLVAIFAYAIVNWVLRLF